MAQARAASPGSRATSRTAADAGFGSTGSLRFVPPSRRSLFGARWVAAVVGLALVVAVVVVLIVALGGNSSPTTGYDVSYPQCSGSYPSSPLFGIVGVNGGLANNANRCLSGELRWARQAPGQKRPTQPAPSL